MSDTEIRLAIFGGTGEGKTSFVVQATDAPLEIGDDADSCTQDIQTGSVMIDGKKVTLIDTPGFDDTESKDTKIFEKIAVWLAESRAHGKYLHGVILVQSVSGARVPNSERQRTRLFKKIIGEQFYNRVAIVTTMWDTTKKSKGEQGEHNRVSKPEIWGDMLAAGAKVFRFQNTKQSAIDVVRHYTENPFFSVPVSTLLQDELVIYDGVLAKTSAAKQFDADLGVKVEGLGNSKAEMGGDDELPKVDEYIKDITDWRTQLKEIAITILAGVVKVFAPAVVDFVGSKCTIM
ncbi:P-loop containing nucleoside triphosphate hydrolase protein [Nemania abortiva]|nr:P-loop containing nucleoside triphosphate hydrolase protein [Nemania abortiva]